MKSIPRLVLMTMLLGVFGVPTHAQAFSSAVSTPSTGGFDGIIGWNLDSAAASSSWGGSAASTSSTSPAGYVYVHGDGSYVPSTYMDYPAALELGKQILAKQAIPPAPLGDVARNSRALAAKTAAAGKTTVVTQDDTGKMLICRAASSRCQ